MTSILNKFKSLAIVVMVLSLFMGVTLNSCTTDKKSENTENVEAASSESEEHPAGEENPTDEEHPSDSTKEEHPTSEEK